MSPKYMLDTNICIYLMKHQPPEVRKRITECFVGDVVISAITLTELEFGIHCTNPASQKTNRAALRSLLDDIPVARFDAKAA
jgi:tRNA(fMet)-specific endonuclease VapC